MTTVSDVAAPPVDLLRLVVLVRARRVLRIGVRSALAALPAWFVVVLAAIVATDDDSTTHLWFEDHATRGFVVALVVLAAALVLAPCVRLAGPVGTLAVALMPIWRAVPYPVVGPKSGPSAGRLLDVGSLSRRVPRPDSAVWLTVVLGLVVVVLVPGAAITATQVHPQYQGSHGQGGPVVTLGEDSRITRMVKKDSLSTDYSYFISSPAGEARVETERKPDDGTRYTIVRTSSGLQAVRLGGFSWVTTLVASIVMFLLGCVALYFLVRRLAARVPDERMVPLATTVGELARRKNYGVHPVPRVVRQPPPPPTPLAAMRDSGDADEVARRSRQQVRRTTGALVALLVLVGLVTAVV